MLVWRGQAEVQQGRSVQQAGVRVPAPSPLSFSLTDSWYVLILQVLQALELRRQGREGHGAILLEAVVRQRSKVLERAQQKRQGPSRRKPDLFFSISLTLQPLLPLSLRSPARRRPSSSASLRPRSASTSSARRVQRSAGRPRRRLSKRMSRTSSKENEREDATEDGMIDALQSERVGMRKKWATSVFTARFKLRQRTLLE